MCVTNTTHRRVPAISLSQSQLVNASAISQRLMGGYSAPEVMTGGHCLPQQFVANAYLPTTEASRPKRRRKPQKPGKTAKMHDRHFVVHNYHDHAEDDVPNNGSAALQQPELRRKGGVSVPFPIKLHAVLDQVMADGLGHIISWQSHGRCFLIHRPKEFVETVMPRYFRQSKLTSFQRQLNLYGFSRLTRGPDAGGYYHELFLQGKVDLCQRMERTKVKGTKFKAASSPEQEPDFYTMKPVSAIVTPNHSDEESASHYSDSFASMPQQHQQMAPAAYVPQSFYETPRYPQQQQQQDPYLNDRVFDDAVDDLFMDEFLTDPALSEFVHDWDPTDAVEPDIQDDDQLGYLLEQLLD